MTCSDEEIEHLLHLSFGNEDSVLDVTFDVEEVDAVLVGRQLDMMVYKQNT